MLVGGPTKTTAGIAREADIGQTSAKGAGRPTCSDAAGYHPTIAKGSIVSAMG